MYENNVSLDLRGTNKKSRAVVLRCSDAAFCELMSLIRTVPDCYIVFSKSSNMKLVVSEVPF